MPYKLLNKPKHLIGIQFWMLAFDCFSFVEGNDAKPRRARRDEQRGGQEILIAFSPWNNIDF